MSIIERLTALFAPDDCLICGREGALLCRACQGLLPPLPGSCFHCNAPTAAASCQPCTAACGLDELTVVAGYTGAAKALVGYLKFSGNQSAARLIADALGEFPLAQALLTHMPATTAHVRQRGYDQSALIVRQLSRTTGLPRITALRRSGQQHQLGADRALRLQQMTTALSVRTSVRGHHIIIVDDVLTTGSSLQAAAVALRQAGARRISALVFAQA